jgi:hypothetical protein
MIKITPVWTTRFKEFVDDVVNNITSTTMVILDCLDEVDYYDRVFNKQDIDRLLKITHQHNVPVKIITANINRRPNIDRYPHVSITCWSVYWFVRTYRVWTYKEADEYNLSKGINIRDVNVCKNFELTYPFICLNNIEKKHRGIMMDMLAKYDLIKHGAISWRAKSWPSKNNIGDYQFKYWNQELLILDQGLDVKFKQETMPNEFSNSLQQVVTESDDTDSFFTEKTATPIFLNKPFIVASGPGFHRYLKNHGFELYDELFDYSFDDDPDMESRYDKIAQNLKPYIGLSPSELQKHYDKVADKITYNRELAMKYAFDIPKEIMDLHLLVEKNVPEYTGPINNIKYIGV